MFKQVSSQRNSICLIQNFCGLRPPNPRNMASVLYPLGNSHLQDQGQIQRGGAMGQFPL